MARNAKEEVASASRIPAALGVVDAFGHVSRRAPGATGRFLMSRSLAPARVRAQDVLTLDLDARAVDDPGARLFLERFIHAEIFRKRPDIGAVVHAHSRAVLPFTIVPGIRVRPACHVCGFLAGLTEPFDLAHHAGDGTDLLISNAEHGRMLARHLGSASVALMRGHGFTAVGSTIQEAVFRAVYTVHNCEIQRNAIGLGAPVYLTDAEAAACDRTTAGQANRAWDLWVEQAERAHSSGTAHFVED